ncbi:ribulose 1,5-bisphosphate carboxylase large subunit-like protein [Paenibacillus sp. W4I10]|nr:ribulose 1,5-bisphosphate carboxylase large subunit-like protein [Paenibacillus sp. W4I10]
MNNMCTATYRLHDDHADFRKKAQSIAIGMTVGSWTELPQAQREAMQKHLGEVISVEVHEADGEWLRVSVTPILPSDILMLTSVVISLPCS